MRFFTLQYHFKEAMKGFRYGAIMSMATITTVAISLTILGAFLIFYANLNQLMGSLESHLQVTFYLSEQLIQEDVKLLTDRLERDDRVRDFKIISAEEALGELKKELGEDARLLDELGENPLPNSVEVQLYPLKDFSAFQKEYEDFSAVGESSSGQEWVEKLSKLISLSRTFGTAVLVLLGLANLIIIANAIQLTVFARREEIEIMRLVGATNWFIRIPFLMEGVLQGILGAFISIFILTISYTLLQERLAELVPTLKLLSMGAVLIQMHLKLCFLGILLGFLGSLLSLRRFLV